MLFLLMPGQRYEKRTMDIPSRTLRLSDGRQLGYAEFGPPDGSPVFYMHGFPGSRIEAMLLTRYTSARIIALDRPGMGLSTFQPNRRYLDWPNDVIALADHLKIEEFRILGISGGSPYVLACCKEIPRSRLRAAAIIAGAYPLELGTEGMLLPLRALMYIAGSSFLSPLAKPLLNWEMGNLARNPDPEAFRTQFLKIMSTRPEKDRKCLEDDFVATGVIESTREAFKQDSDGVTWDLKMIAQPWGFELEEVDFPGLVSAVVG